MNGYPFRPGLHALIELGEEAEGELKQPDGALSSALKNAKTVYAAGQASDKEYCDTIRSLRNAIRNLKGTVPQADNYYLKLFRQGGAF